MDTVSRTPRRHRPELDHRAAVINKLLTVAGASGGGITLILGAAAYGAIPDGLAYLAVSAFGGIMITALLIAGIYIART